MAKKSSRTTTQEELDKKLKSYAKNGTHSSEIGHSTAYKVHDAYVAQQNRMGRASTLGALQQDGYYLPTLERGIRNNDQRIIDVALNLAKNSTNGKYQESQTVRSGQLMNDRGIGFSFTVPQTAQKRQENLADKIESNKCMPVTRRLANKNIIDTVRTAAAADPANIRRTVSVGNKVANDMITKNLYRSATNTMNGMLKNDTEIARLRNKNPKAYEETVKALSNKANSYSDMNSQMGLDISPITDSDEDIIRRSLVNNGISPEEANMYAKNWKLYELYDKKGYAYDYENEQKAPMTVDEQTETAKKAMGGIAPEQKAVIDRLFEESEKYHDRTQAGNKAKNNRTVALAKDKLVETGLSEDMAQWYAENWQYMNALIEGAPYRADRQAVLDQYGDEAYQNAISVLEARNNKNPFNLLNKDFKNSVAENTAALHSVTGDDLERYLQYVQENEDEKNTFNRNLAIKEAINEHPKLVGIPATVGADLGEVASGLVAMGEFTRATGYADKNAPVNVYSDRYALKNIDNSVHNSMMERIALEGELKGDSQELIALKQEAYGIINSTLTSGVSILIGKGIGTAASALGTSASAASTIAKVATLTEFSTNAFTSTYQEAIESGIKHENAILTATVAAVAEAAFEEISLEQMEGMFFDWKKGDVSALKKTLLFGFRGLTEGSEEAFTDLANYYGDYLINGGFSEYEQLIRQYEQQWNQTENRLYTREEAANMARMDIVKNIAVSFRDGLASGLILGGIPATAANISIRNTANTIVSTPELSSVKAKILDTARKQGTNTTAKQIVTELDTSGREATAKDISNILQSEIELGEDENTNVEEVVTEVVNSIEDMSEEEKTEAIDTIMSSLSTESENVTEEQENKLTETLAKNEKLSETYANAVTGDYAPASNTVAIAKSAAKSANESNKANAERYKQYKSGQKKGMATVRVNGENATVTRVLKDGKVEVYSKGKGFQSVGIGSVMYASSNASYVHNFLSHDSMISEQNATALASQYKTSIPAQTWVEGVRTAFLEGAANTGSIESLLDNGRNAFVSVVPQDTLAIAYALGKEYANSQTKAEVKAPAKRLEQGRVLNKTGELEGKVDERTQMLAEAIAMITGNNIQFVDAMVNGSDGKYNSSTRTITISLEHLNTAGQLKATDILKVLGHEALGEYFEKVNPKGYDEVRKATIDLLEKVEGSSKTNATIKSIMKAYQKTVESGKTLEEASGELANNLIAEIMFSEEGAKDIVNIINEFSPEESQSIFQKFINLINSLIDDIKSLFEGRNTGISAVAEVEDLERVRDLFKKEFVKGVRSDIESMNAEKVYDAAVKEAGEPVKSFSMDADIEQTDKLIAVHNLSQEQLINTFKLGGFPAPSIAIIRTSMGHDMYGEVSVFFDKDAIDPKKNRWNRVSSGDVWSPTFPSVEYKVSRDKVNDIHQKIYEIVPDNIIKALGSPSLDYDNAQDKLNRRSGNPVEAYGESAVIQYAYLLDSGKKVEVPTKADRLSRKYNNSAIVKISDEVFKGMSIDETYDVMHELSSWVQSEFNQGKREQIVNILNEDFEKKYDNEPEKKGAFLRKFGKRYKLEDMGFADYDNIIHAVIKYKSFGIESVPDDVELKKNITNVIADNKESYNKWVENLFDGVIEAEGIRNSKDLFTPSGNRRSWDQLHDPVTLDNVVKAMRSENAKGSAAFFGESAIQAIAKKDFKSLDEIRGAKKQLRVETEEEHEAVVNSQVKKFSDIVAKMVPEESRNYFMERERVVDNIVDTIREFSKAEDIERDLRKWIENVPEGVGQDIIDLMEEIGNNATGYFEAKPMRPVGFNEIAYVLLPENADSELINALKRNNISYVTYETDNAADRLAKMQDNSESVSFSVDYSGVKTIKSGMTDEVRTEILKNRVIQFEDYTPYEIENKIEKNNFIGGHRTNDLLKSFKPIHQELVGDRLFHSNDLPEVEFQFSLSGLKESIVRQTELFDKTNEKKDYTALIKLLENFDNVISNSVLIYANDKDRYKGTIKEDADVKSTYVFCGMLSEEKYVYPVKLLVKERYNNPNGLYVAITVSKIKKTRFMEGPLSTEDKSDTTPLVFKTTLPQILQYVNTNNSDFIKYFPDGLLTSEQIKSKNKQIEIDNEEIRTLVKNIDSEGNNLTREQMSRNKNTQIKDENGRIIPMYHGTPTGGFTVFKSRSGIFYATANKEYAARYMNPSASSIRGYAVEATNPMIYEGYLNVTKPFDILNDPEAKRIFVEEYIKGGNAAGINPYISDAEINKTIKNGIDWTEADNLKEFFDDNEYDYDGIILNEGADGGYGDEVVSRGTSVAFFKSNQFKTKENKNPTKSEDIYRSIDYKIDEDAIEIFMDNDNSSSFLNADTEVGKVSTRAISIIEEGMKSASKLNIEVDEKLVAKIANKILKDNNSKFDKDILQSNLKNVFAYIKDHGGKVSYDDLMSVMDEIARPVLEKTTQNTGEGFEDRSNIIDYLKSNKIKLDSGQLQEVKNTYGSYNNFRTQQGLMPVWNNDGVFLDDIWEELCDVSGGYLDIATNPNDQPTVLLATLESLKGKEIGLLEGESLDQAARDLSIDIFREFFELQSGENIQSNNTLRQAYTQAVLELNTTKKELEKAYAKDGAKAKQQAMEDAAAVNRLASLESVMADIDYDINTAINQYGDMYLAEDLKKQRKVYEERIEKLKKENKAVRDKLADVKLRNRNTRTQQMYDRRNKELKKRIQKNMDYLNSLLKNETEKKHVPVDMVSQVIDICKLVTPEQTNSKVLQQKLDRLNNLYNQYQSDGTFMEAKTGGFNGDNTSFIDYDKNLSDKIQRLSKVLGQRKYTQLMSPELVEVLDITNAIRTQIRNANKLIANKKLSDAREASEKMMNEVRASGGKTNAFNTAVDRYMSAHLNSYREFRKLSGYIDDGALMALWEQFDEGQLKSHQIEKEIDDIFNDVLDGKENQKMVKRLTSFKPEDMVDIGIKDADGNPVLVTRGMRLSLIMHTYNGSNMAHVLGDGIVIPDMKMLKAGKVSEAYSNGETYRLVDYTAWSNAIAIEDKNARDMAIKQLQDRAVAKLKTLEGQLDQYEQKFLEDAKEMFWRYTGKKINETSVKLNGYAKARVENYFPIKVDPNFTAQDFAALIMDGTIEGMGMLKGRVTSKKSILLEDITNVIIRQTSNVAKYAGFAIPIRNINMVMNMTTRDNNGTKHNLQQTITRSWGQSNTDYLKNLMRDIQGGRHEDMALFTALRGNFAGATLNLNPVVALKQAASMPTAAATLGWGPLLKAQKDIGKGFFRKQGLEELEKINPLLWFRNKGNSTEELGDIRAKKGFGEKLSNVGMLNWIQNMDSGTVRTLEYASKYYVDEQIKKNAKGYKNIREGSKLYWEKVSEIFTKTVEDTQPNYTVLQKAAISRTEHSLVKNLFMFKTQPLQNFGIMYDALGELNAKVKQNKKLNNETSLEELKEARSKFAKALSSQIAAALVYSSLDVFVKALLLNRWYKYKDDEDKDKDGSTDDIAWNDMLEAILLEGVTNTLLGGFIGGSEIYSFVKSRIKGETYYGIEVPVVEMVNDFAESITKLQEYSGKYREAETTADRQKYWNKLQTTSLALAGQTASFFGIPFNNVKNIFDSIYRYAVGIGSGDTLAVMGPETDMTQRELIMEAFIAGNMDEYNRLLEETRKETTGKTMNITNDVKEAYYEGTVSEEQAIDYIINNMSSVENETEARLKLDEWDWKEEHPDESYDANAKTEELQKYLNSKDWDKAKKEIATLQERGISDDSIKKGIKNACFDEYQELKQKRKSANYVNSLAKLMAQAGLYKSVKSATDAIMNNWLTEEEKAKKEAEKAKKAKSKK